MKLHRPVLLPILLVALACGEGDPPTGPLRQLTPCADPAPLLGSPDERLPDSYIVVFDGGTNATAVTARLEQTHGFTAKYVYTSVLQGFAADMPRETMQAVRCEPEVRFVEHDAVGQLF